MNVGLSQPFGSTYHPWTMVAIRMLSLDRGLVYRELDEEARHLSAGVEKGKPLEVFPVFHAPPEGVNVVDLLLPYVGVATGLPVLKDTETDFSVNDVVSKAKLDESDAGPFKIETMSLAADDSSDTKQDEKSTTVTVAGDVTFATDSDQLSAQADSVNSGTRCGAESGEKCTAMHRCSCVALKEGWSLSMVAARCEGGNGRCSSWRIRFRRVASSMSLTSHELFEGEGDLEPVIHSVAG